MGMPGKTIRRSLTAALFAAGMMACPAALRADDVNSDVKAPTTRPTKPSLRDAFGGGGRRSEFGGPAQGTNGPNQGPGNQRRNDVVFSQEEIDAAIAFFNENSPIRMKYFKQLPENGPARRIVTQGLVRTYRPIQNFKDQNPDLYNLLVQQIKLRDEAFQLALDSEKGSKEADQKLRDKATQIVDVTLKARALRIELLQQQVTEQQNKLAEDQANPGGQVDTELNTIRADEQRLIRRMDRMSTQHGQSMIPPELPDDPLALVGPDMPTD